VFLATFPFSKSLNLGVRVIRPFRGHVNEDAVSRRPVLETRRSLSNNKSRAETFVRFFRQVRRVDGILIGRQR